MAHRRPPEACKLTKGYFRYSLIFQAPVSNFYATGRLLVALNGYLEESSVFKRKGLSGGVYFKNSGAADDAPIEPLGPPPFVTIPLIQTDGRYGETPAIPVVKVGDQVTVGRCIAQPSGPDSAAVHASVSGVVRAIGEYPFARTGRGALAITIENDGSDSFTSPIPYDKPWRDCSPAEIVNKICLAGIIDERTGIPLCARLAAAGSGGVDLLVVNTLAPEPWSAAGTRLLIEQPSRRSRGHGHLQVCGGSGPLHDRVR